MPRFSSAIKSPNAFEIQSSFRRTLRKPGPATSGLSAIGERSIVSATFCARSRGLPLIAFARAMQPLA